MPKPLRVGLITFVCSALFLGVFALQSLPTMIIGGLIFGAYGALLATPMPSTIKAGLSTGLVGIVFVLTYASERPSIAIIGALLGGVAAGLLASQNQHRDTPREGAIQGAIAGGIAGLVTVATLLVVWQFVAGAAGISAEEFAAELKATVPFAESFDFGSDVAILVWLAFMSLAAAVVAGALIGAARTVEGPQANWLVYGVLGLISVVLVLAFGSKQPSVLIIAAILSGIAAGLLASHYRHRDTPREGATQGAIAGAVASLFPIAALLIVWQFIAGSADISPEKFTAELLATVPGAQALNLGSDVSIVLWLIFLSLVASALIGSLIGATRTGTDSQGSILVYGVLGLVVCSIPWIDFAADLQLLNSIIPILVFILLALGLNIVVGYAGLLDLGYAAFFAIGAYTTGMLSSPHLGINLNFWLVVWIAAGVAAMAGLLLGAPTLPLRGDYLAIVTLGFGEIVPIAFRNLGGGGATGSLSLSFLNIKLLDQVDLTGGPSGITPITPPKLPLVGVFRPDNQIPWFYLIVGILVLTLFFINRLRGSRQGRAWTAMREDELAADAMGINIVRTKLMAFAMGATFSGFAGAFYGAFIGSIFPSSFEFSVSIIVLCMVILGGLGNMAGVIVGGLLIMGADRLFLPEAANLIRDIAQTKTGSSDIAAYQDLTQLRLLLFGLVLVVMMAVRPEGLLPNARRKAELHADDETTKQENSDLYDAERDPQLAGR